MVRSRGYAPSRLAAEATRVQHSTGLGAFLLVTRYWEGGISVLPFDPDTGAIGEVTAAPDHKGAGPHPLRQSAPHPHGVHGDPRTNLVYAMDLGTDKVHQYILDIATGTLAPQGEVELAPGAARAASTSTRHYEWRT